MKLYGYWRSSAAYRVRIALNLKGLHADSIAINLADGAQSDPAYARINPHGRVPFLVDEAGHGLGQSLAIINHLDRLYPEPPLYPADSMARARVEAIALTIACDIHPLNNLKVLKYLKGPLGKTQADVDAWYRHWIVDGLAAVEAAADPDGPYLAGDQVTVADLCLVPQLYNARRFDTDLSAFPRLLAADARLCSLDAFAAAAPERQADAS